MSAKNIRASPQLEKGYTRISNELIEAICNKVSNSTWTRILLWTARLTYGFRRKEVETNYASYATKLNLTKDTIKNALIEMENQKLVVVARIGPERFVITINKDYDLWKV